MYNNQIFSAGVHSVFQASWTLQCETPLAIRNGLSIIYQEPKAIKSRGLKLKFNWKTPKGGDKQDEYEVAALHYGYEIVDSNVASYHFVPPSSVRGALRSWTVNHIVQPEFRSRMTPPGKEDEQRTNEYLANVRKALGDRHSGYPLIASLFGMAFETREEAEKLANAGRFQVETEKFHHSQAHPITANGLVEQGEAGPLNARRQMTVRNPLDRLTHASKEQGLHHFLEFSRGESFKVNLSILNPQASDIGLVSLWVRELNDGMLRIGALSSIGRGRISVKEEAYTLWRRLGAPALDDMAKFVAFDGSQTDDALAGIWNGYTLPKNALHDFEEYLREEVVGSHAQSQSL